ncbi:hypothetical protein [Ramlibacter rhizophilus]|uniref:Uncharacterized protein n=1 Tax=Ramlibacter rhizophilus TaxID=1781167 RepID=A0A4Z0BKB6_9BURK|nr:hypothetical protein [Ramlibacter rhizophilus]TFY99755.1 hypothetical protein EZ242_11485 [Ramlibacter rhizophilus]
MPLYYYVGRGTELESDEQPGSAWFRQPSLLLFAVMQHMLVDRNFAEAAVRAIVSFTTRDARLSEVLEKCQRKGSSGRPQVPYEDLVVLLDVHDFVRQQLSREDTLRELERMFHLERRTIERRLARARKMVKAEDRWPYGLEAMRYRGD